MKSEENGCARMRVPYGASVSDNRNTTQMDDQDG
jgi:hypothetical protein